MQIKHILVKANMTNINRICDFPDTTMEEQWNISSVNSVEKNPTSATLFKKNDA